jgi:hypothetical protein
METFLQSVTGRRQIVATGTVQANAGVSCGNGCATVRSGLPDKGDGEGAVRAGLPASAFVDGARRPAQQAASRALR